VTTETGVSSNPLQRTLHRLRNDPAGLAALRRGLGRPSKDAPDVWPWTIPLTGDRGVGYENAVHHALTLYAAHQQGQSATMHQPGISLGDACAQLAGRHHSREPIERRFTAVATADSVDDLAAHLRGLVTLLRGHGLPLDYERLVADLRWWADAPHRSRVRHRWGRDFYRFNDPSIQPRDTDVTDAEESR
jgi:CRISPR system Cascade subunit CasB